MHTFREQRSPAGVHGQMLTRCEHTMRTVCAELDVDLIEFNGEADHMPVLVADPPTLAISTLV